MRRFLLVLVCATVSLCLGPLPTLAADIDESATIKAIVKKHRFEMEDIGYVLIDLDIGKNIDAWHEEKSFVPGSVLKLATSLVAWKILGPDFRFVTSLWQKNSALYLKGSGDPVLTTGDLRSLLQQAPTATSSGIWQGFYIDTTAMLPTLEISQQQPLAADYNPGLGALNVNFNRLAVDWQLKQSSPHVSVTSHADDLSVPVDWLGLMPISADLPSGAAFILASPGSEDEPERWSYDADLHRAGLAETGGFFLPAKHADAMTARIFRAIAEHLGLNLPMPQTLAVPSNATLLAQHNSPALSEILQGLLRYSNNMTAEMIGLTAAAHITGHAMTLQGAAQMQVEWLQSHIHGVDWQSFRMVNHSGLDGENRATPRQMASILSAIWSEPSLVDCLNDLQLPVSKNLQIKAKSGTMDYAAGLAGFISNANGHHYAYAIFVSDDDQRAALAMSFDPRVLHPARNGRAWTERARALEDDLLLHWSSEIKP